MIGVRSRDSRVHLLARILAPVLIAGVTDTVLRTLGWNQPAGEIWPAFAPRGAAIGVIWIILFGCMGAAHWCLTRTAEPASRYNANLVVALIATCLAYPFTTHFLRGHLTELLGNVASFGLALAIVLRVRRESRMAAVLVGLVAAWILFATALVFALVQLNGWQTS